MGKETVINVQGGDDKSWGGLVECLLQQSVLCVDDNVLFKGLLPWVGAVEDFVDLLQCSALGFNKAVKAD